MGATALEKDVRESQLTGYIFDIPPEKSEQNILLRLSGQLISFNKLIFLRFYCAYHSMCLVDP